MGDLLAQESLGNFLHLLKDHGRDLFSSENLFAILGVDLHVRLVVLVDKFEGEVLHVALNSFVSPVPTDQTLGVENSVLRVGGQLILGGISNQTLTIRSEGNIRGGDTVTLVIGNNFNASVFKHTDTEKELQILCRKNVKFLTLN